METAVVVKAGLILLGILIMALSFYMNAVRKLTVNIAVVWEILGAVLLIIGAVPALSAWCYRIGTGTAVAMFIIALLILWGGFQFSRLISSLIIKNQELAMQVSLLNQENERILEQLRELTGKDKSQL